MTTTTRTRWQQLSAQVAAEVDAGTLDRESALYREFVEAARERARVVIEPAPRAPRCHAERGGTRHIWGALTDYLRGAEEARDGTEGD
jgi:hypothetical protein